MPEDIDPAVALKLCELTRECPSCEGHPPLPMGPCQRCRNVGRIPLLDEDSRLGLMRKWKAVKP